VGFASCIVLFIKTSRVAAARPSLHNRGKVPAFTHPTVHWLTKQMAGKHFRKSMVHSYSGLAVAVSPAAVLGLVLFGSAVWAEVQQARTTVKGLVDLAQENKLDENGAAEAAGLLAHDDPFVRGLAEWAIAMKVGYENNGQQAVWPKADPPQWYQHWSDLPRAMMLEHDWVRQAISHGLDEDAQRLLASIDTMIDRARRMARDFTLRGASSRAMEIVEGRLALMMDLRCRLEQRIRTHPTDLAGHARLWLEARGAMHDVALANPAVDFDRILLATRFAPHTVRNITRTFAWQHKPGGDLCVLTGLRPDGKLKGLVSEQLGPGHLHSVDLSWDADRAVFSYARQPVWPPDRTTTTAAGEGAGAHDLRKTHEPLRLYESALVHDELRPLTDDPYWNDFEPAYCPDGTIVFASDRCGRSAECGPFNYDIANANLYRLSADGSTIQRVTDSKDLDRYPNCLNNGRLVYTHWEYQERHFMEVHSLWTCHPDGRMADAVFKQHMKAPLGLRAARSVPTGDKLVAVATGHHTFAYGPVVVIDSSIGLNDTRGIEIITPGVRPQEGPMAGQATADGGVPDRGGLYQTPWALSGDCFLVSYAYARPKCSANCGADSNGFAIYLIDSYGNRELIYRDRLLSSSHPMPLIPRSRPPQLPDLTDQKHKTAVCYVADVHEGLEGIPRGTVKYLRISQHIAWPLNAKRGMEPYFGGAAYGQQFGYWSWSPVRVIGTVPVEADGSACFTVPADTGVYFQALDERFMEIRRMRSLVGFQHGEVRGCRGCHESQSKAPEKGTGLISRNGPQGASQKLDPSSFSALLALTRPPREPTPPSWGAERMLGYEWLVQPILDQHCVRCHGAEDPDGGIDLTGRRAEDGFAQSFRTMFGRLPGGQKTNRHLVAVADRFSDSSVSKPKQFGSHRSSLITVLLEDELHRREVGLNDDQWVSLVTWVDANAPYFDRFINKRPTDGGPPRRDVTPAELANR
jgi:hypothetical protein